MPKFTYKVRFGTKKLNFVNFWAPVCKTVCPMLSVRCMSVLSVMSLYCGQTVGWIEMKLGMQVARGPSHIVLDGDPAPPPQIFGPYLLWPNG